MTKESKKKTIKQTNQLEFNDIQSVIEKLMEKGLTSRPPDILLRPRIYNHLYELSVDYEERRKKKEAIQKLKSERSCTINGNFSY